jgi:hypothetical protein
MIEKVSRGKGYGRRLFVMSLKEYFKRHGLEKIICQPSSLNPYPNKMMEALGVKPIKTYRTMPSVICYEHEVNRYEWTKGL